MLGRDGRLNFVSITPYQCFGENNVAAYQRPLPLQLQRGLKHAVSRYRKRLSQRQGRTNGRLNKSLSLGEGSSPDKIWLWPNVLAGTVAGGFRTSQHYAKLAVDNAATAHGLYAEREITRLDQKHGLQAIHIGESCAKNGADRLVDGISIQTKYCSTGSKCIAECFDELGQWRYMNSDGTPMKIEVPSDKYDDAVRAVRVRIAKGTILACPSSRYQGLS